MMSKISSSVAFCALAVLLIAGMTEGAVSGSVSCGGSGTFGEMESTGCLQAPCTITVETNYTMGITFVAGETTENVQWMLYLYYPNGGVNLVQNTPATGSIVAGQTYRVAGTVFIPSRFGGAPPRPGEVSIMLMNKDNDSRLICGEFAVFVQSL